MDALTATKETNMPSNKNGGDILSRCIRLINDDDDEQPINNPAPATAPLAKHYPILPQVIPSCLPLSGFVPGIIQLVTQFPQPVVLQQPNAFMGLHLLPRPPSTPVLPEAAPPAAETPAPIVVPTCDKCGKKFHTANNLRLHMEEIHERGRGQFTCADCGQVYSRLRSLERHQNQAHLGENPMCRICKKRVVNFDLHYRKFHCKSKSIQAGPRAKRGRKKKAV